MNTSTSLSGYIQTFIAPVVLLGLACMFYCLCACFHTDRLKYVDFMPTYFLACKGASPIRAGVDVLVSALTVAPCGVVAGLSVKRTQRYRPQLWLGWTILVIGMGLMSIIDADSPRSLSIGLLVMPSIGLGILLATTYFPVLAPREYL